MSLENMLSTAARRGDRQSVARVLQSGVPATVEDSLALQEAASGGHNDVVRLLLTHGADIQALENAALRLACARGHLAVVKTLVEQGADVQARSGEPLRMAVQEGHLAVAAYLLLHGADVHAGNNLAMRNTFFGQAVDLDMAALLLRYHVDVRADADAVLVRSLERNDPALLRLVLADQRFDRKFLEGLLKSSSPLGVPVDTDSRAVIADQVGLRIAEDIRARAAKAPLPTHLEHGDSPLQL